MELKDWLSLGLTASGLIVSVIGMFVALAAFRTSTRLSSNTFVQGQLNSYFTTYREVYREASATIDGGDPLLSPGYRRLSSKLQVDAQIVAGLLVMVIDDMRIANDPRTDTWIKFLPGVSGPILEDRGFELEIFTVNKDTRKAIREAREALKRQQPSSSR